MHYDESNLNETRKRSTSTLSICEKNNNSLDLVFIFLTGSKSKYSLEFSTNFRKLLSAIYLFICHLRKKNHTFIRN